MPASLLKFQIGPVQDFIAQARSTRDLWSGSYLLSWLVAHGIRALPASALLVFPSRERQPLLKDQLDPEAVGILIPNLPNIFIARVEDDAAEAAAAVKKAIEAEWAAIVDAVLQWLRLDADAQTRFRAQAERHLSISWMITPIIGAYHEAYRDNGWHLDAVRQTREFRAWDSGNGSREKDSLSGKEESIYRGSGRWDRSDMRGRLLDKHEDHMGAISLIKRVWHLAYLGPEKRLKADSKHFIIRSIPAIAARQSRHDDEDDPQERSSDESYIAAIAFDGDSIGRWVNGDFLPDPSALEAHHRNFSKDLSTFAIDRVPEIVRNPPNEPGDQQRPPEVPLGQLIYAGGDDVVCLVPAGDALRVAAALRSAFRDCMDSTPSTGERPDASAGIAIAHIHAPLQDLIREAQRAEKRAKNEGPRPAFSVTIMKRSGKISHWTTQWDSGGLGLFSEIAGHLKGGALSNRFPHRVCEQLMPYLTSESGLSRQQDAINDQVTAKALIHKEFAHIAERQGSRELAAGLSPFLTRYVDKLPQNTQAMLRGVIELCSAVAFAKRTASETKPAAAPALP